MYLTGVQFHFPGLNCMVTTFIKQKQAGKIKDNMDRASFAHDERLFEPATLSVDIC